MLKKIFLPILIITFFNHAYAQGGVWTWMNGDSVDNITFSTPKYSYGQQGVANILNCPQAKYQGAHCIDRQNNLWVYGGTNNADLWKYNIANNIWTWIKGDTLTGLPAIYGTQGIPSPLNNPPSTYIEGMLISDTANNLWLLSGVSNVLWKYDMASNNWVWMKGNPNNPSPIYGTQGIPSINNTPGVTTENKSLWIDKSNNLWLLDNFYFMWKYDISTNLWTWMKGDTNASGNGSYGIKGVSNATNQPPYLSFTHTTWKDKNDKFYIYEHSNSIVWQFDYITNNWTWVNGDSASGNKGRFIQQCSPSSDKVPTQTFEERGASGLFCADVFWLFGGDNLYFKNDLWQFNPNTMQWTWVSGDSSSATPYSYGTKGIPSTTNYPEGTVGHCLWVDNDNNLWLFGGGNNNSLWRFTPDIACIKNTGLALFTLPLPSDTIICGGDTTVMQLPDSLETLSILPNNNYFISQDSSKIYFYPTQNSNYIISASKGKTCPSFASLSFNITINNTGSITHNPIDTLLCKGENATLIINNKYSISYLPSTNIICNADTTLLTFSPTVTTTYTLITSSNDNCKLIDTIQFTIKVFELPIANFIVTPETASKETPIFTYTNTSANSVGYRWLYNNQEFATSENTTKTFLDTGIYCITLVACNALNCCDTILKCNSIVDQLIIVPNAFSPDDNGNNDFFEVITKNVNITNMVIVDRFGNKVFEKQNKNDWWNGKFLNKKCDIGTYFYYIQYYNGSQKQILKGDLSLIR